MLRIASFKLKENTDERFWESVDAINPHIVVLSHQQQPAGNMKEKYPHEAKDIRYGRIFSKFGIHDQEHYHVITSRREPVLFNRVTFVRPLGSFDLFLFDAAHLDDGSSFGDATEFLATAQPLSIIHGNVKNEMLFSDRGLICAPLVRAANNYPYRFWLSTEMAQEFNKLEPVNIAGTSGLLLEVNVRIHDAIPHR